MTATKKTARKSTRKSTRRSSSAKRADNYQLITDKLVELMDAGTIPWRKTWNGVANVPRSVRTGKPYRGINVFLLSILGAQYSSPYWLTFKQAKELGGTVRKGERGVQVVYWSTFQLRDENGKPAVDGNGKPKTGMYLKRYTVFNLEQTDDVQLPPRRLRAIEENGGQAEDGNACERARAIFDAYTSRESISVSHGGDRAFYAPALDSITLPNPEAFECLEGYCGTAFHEAGHSTGTSARLSRPGIENFDYHGSHTYADEELVAEFTATFLCSVSGIERTEQVENSAAYLASWKKRCQEDPKLLVYAAQRAQKAADFILGEQLGADDDEGEDE